MGDSLSHLDDLLLIIESTITCFYYLIIKVYGIITINSKKVPLHVFIT